MKFKKNIGIITEDAVQKIVEDAFSSDFIFRSPRRVEGKEVTDILVLFDDFALIIQVKSEAIKQASGCWEQKPLRGPRAAELLSGPR